MFEVDFHILNQKATPAIYADILANRPAAGFAGRLFVATDSPYGVFRDTGTAWVQVASNGGGSGSSTGVNGLNGTTNIGLGGTLINNTTIAGGNFNLNFNGTKNFAVSNNNTSNAGTTQINLLNNQLNLICDSVTTQSAIFINGLSINSNFNASVDFGLYLDNINGKSVLGDYSNQRKYNSFVVNDDTNEFYLTTSFNQSNTDQDLFFASNAAAGTRFVKLGDFNSYFNNNSIIVDDANNEIKSTTFSGNNGFYITNDDQLFGNLNGSQTYLSINVQSQILSTKHSGIQKGLNLDFNNDFYTLGDENNNYISINNSTNTFQLNSQIIDLNGSNLQSNTSGGNSGEHLVISLNGNQYKIALQNP